LSHIQNIDVRITSLEAAQNAAQRLGGALIRDVKTFEWYGSWGGDTPPPLHLLSKEQNAELEQILSDCIANGTPITKGDYRNYPDNYKTRLGHFFEQCNHKITFPGTSYEIGLKLMPEGYYAPIFDNFCEVLKAKVGGETAPLLRQYIAIETAKLEATNLGYGYEETALPNGTIAIEVYVP